MQTGRLTRGALLLYGVAALAFLYLPLVAVAFASVSKARYLTFPIRAYDTKWYGEAIASDTVQSLLLVSLKVAGIVTVVSMVVGFFGALAFARYHWRFRRLFQKLILLPIFFPQTVLGLALLMWFNALGVTPSWQTAVVGHLVWISPIATLVISIRAYSFDPTLEEAARDMGATTWQILRDITFPLLLPGVVSAGLFSFLLSWGNFPLSLFTTGADSTLPEWLYAKMVSGYSPLVPTLGILSVAASAGVLAVALIAPAAVRLLRSAGPREAAAPATTTPTADQNRSPKLEESPTC
ncbi:ABC transporter permease [Caenispirillum bisanense]|uniref:Spermidine/putrescine transport system permease protein n=1 Tax=Caenispirillum bisanense TaxID=414052 RepID=A0A286GA83_9PROT|nr:ABC transporter permease [Caenispirillum bisanense]SOD91884.1 spermidine/putrescine transport system permease protein [Caenispirillum bisanense]